MAGLRKGHCYSQVYRGLKEGFKRAYTRKSKYKKKNFIKSVPANRIIRYHMGDQKKSYGYRLTLKAKQPVQIRHNSIESSRLVINRRLNIKLGNSYHFHIKVFPHHVLRENKMLTGAGADRMQTGMQRAFGKAMGLAAQIKKSQTLFSIEVDKENINDAITALKLGIPRMPGKFVIEQEKI